MISTTLGTNTLLTTQLQRRLSDLAPVRHLPATRSQSSQSSSDPVRCVRRHVSDLAMRPLIQGGHIRHAVTSDSREGGRW